MLIFCDSQFLRELSKNRLCKITRQKPSCVIEELTQCKCWAKMPYFSQKNNKMIKLRERVVTK